MKKYLFLTMAILGLNSCSQDDLNNSQNDKNEVSRIILTADNFKLDNESRTSLSPTESGMAFAWSNSDTIGIYPERGDQVCFPIAVGTENNYAWFDGGGWALKPSSKYAAYYPFNKANYFRTSNSVLLVYDGQKQTGSASTSHLGAYDFMAADATMPEEGEVALAFKHVNSVLRFNIKMPQAANLTSMALVAEENVLPSQCALNLLTTPATLTPIKSENTIFLDLAEIEVTQAGEQITLYMMIPPCNLTNKSLNAHLIDDKGNSYSAVLTGKNFEAGMAYSFDVEATVSEETTDVTLSSAGTLLDAIGGYDNLLNIKKLKITGEINGDDVYEIRRMTNLEYLNLKDAKIVEGGKQYYEYSSCVTKEGEVGEYMFHEMNGLKEIIIPLNTKTIGCFSIASCYKLHSVTLNEGLESIGQGALGWNTSLTEILLPKSLKIIDNSTFYWSSITNITITENVTTIGKEAFYGYPNSSTLKEIHIMGKPETLTTIGTDAFKGVYETATLYIPKGTKEVYSKTELGRFVNIVEE